MFAEVAASGTVWGVGAGLIGGISVSFFHWLSEKGARDASREEAKLAREDARLAREDAKRARETAADAATHAEESVVQLTAIAKSVNGDRTIMVAKMDKLESVIVKMTQERVAMEEAARNAATEVPKVIKVLMYDDDPSFLEIVQGLLEREASVADGTGFVVETYTKEEEARVAFMKRTHDVYIVDLKLGDKDGLEFIRGLRGAAHMGPFILLSAFVDKAIEDRALNEGVQMVRTKESVIRGNLPTNIRAAIQAFRVAQRAKH